MRIVGPVVINEPVDGYTERMGEPVEDVDSGGLGGELCAVDGLAVDAGKLGEADLGVASPPAQAADAAPDGDAEGDDVSVVWRVGEHVFTVV